jgi:hypothetical protein
MESDMRRPGIWWTSIIILSLAGAGCTLLSPGRRGLNARPPAGAVVLFDGKDTTAWVHKDGEACQWPLVDGAIEVKPGAKDIFTKEKFNDFTLHIEFRTPEPAPTDKGQHRGNSGIYLQGRYEIQVLESFGLPPTVGDCGAIYSIKAPDVNAAFPPLQWQSYDINYRAPRWDTQGKKTENARVTLVWNGRKAHDNAEIPFPTRSHSDEEKPGPGPIQLQDHGFKVQYRNIWIVPAKE